MARDKTPGDKIRRGVVKPRSQVPDHFTGTWTKPKYKAVETAGKLADKQLNPLRKALAGKERIGIQRNEIKDMRDKKALEEITRLEIIDETGRVYVRDPRADGPISVKLSYQDEGRTLKIFVSPRPQEKKGDA